MSDYPPTADVMTHFNAAGDAHMVDIGEKAVTCRRAVASGQIMMAATTLERIEDGANTKGDVLGIARIAGIMAAKKTAELIPLCHPLPLTHISLRWHIEHARNGLQCEVTVETVARTGVEMEALTAVQIALLTVYDMCKSTDRAMVIGDIRLEHKSGGKSGTWMRRQGAV